MHSQILSNQQNFLFDDLNAINSEILKMSDNEIVRVLLFYNKGFTRGTNLRINAQFVSLKTVKKSLSSWEEPFWYIYTAIKV